MFTLRSLQRLVVLSRSVPKTEVTCVRTIKGWQRPFLLVARSKRQQLKSQSIYGLKRRPRYEYTDWNYNAELYAFGKRLGERFDDNLLRVALTDRSYVVKQLQQQAELSLSDNSGDIPDNLPLAVEGENILKQCIQDTLRLEYPRVPEDGISSFTAFLTSTSMISNVSSLIGTTDIILCQEYPPNPETYVTAFKAIVGVLNRSSGPERAQKFIFDLVLTQLSGIDLFDIWEITHPWSKLCHTMKQAGLGIPEPRLIGESGPNTLLAAYVVGLYDANKILLGKGYGETVEIAQEMAARDTLRDLFGIRRPSNGFRFLAEKTGEHSQRLTSLS